VDELAAERPSIFEAFFHSDYPFERAGNGSCVTRGPSGQLAATVLRPEGAQCDAFPQEVRGIPGHVPTRSFHALKVSNPEPAAASLGIYVLRAGPVAGPAVPGPALREEEGGLRLHVPTPECGWVFELLPERPDPASPIIRRLDAD